MKAATVADRRLALGQERATARRQRQARSSAMYPAASARSIAIRPGVAKMVELGGEEDRVVGEQRRFGTEAVEVLRIQAAAVSRTAVARRAGSVASRSRGPTPSRCADARLRRGSRFARIGLSRCATGRGRSRYQRNQRYGRAAESSGVSTVSRADRRRGRVKADRRQGCHGRRTPSDEGDCRSGPAPVAHAAGHPCESRTSGGEEAGDVAKKSGSRRRGSTQIHRCLGSSSQPRCRLIRVRRVERARSGASSAPAGRRGR